MGPKAHSPQGQILFILPTNTTKTAFSTNPQVISASCSRSCKELQGAALPIKLLVIEEILSSYEGSPIKTPESAAVPHKSPVQESEQASTENSPKQTPAPQPVLKRKAEAKSSPATKSSAEPSAKRAKSEVAPSLKLEKFQKRGVVRGKLVKVSYF